MAERVCSVSQLLPDAITVWAGWGVSPMPKRSDDRLIAHFGVQVAEELLSVIESPATDFYAPASDILATDLNEMGRVASERFREKHPGGFGRDCQGSCLVLHIRFSIITSGAPGPALGTWESTTPNQ
jgi:hypothetical protein